VPIALATCVGQVPLGVDDLLAIGTGRTADGPARIAHDDALTDERLTALHADPVGGGDEDRVRVGGRHAENIRHRLALLLLARDRHPVGGDADDVRALERAEPIALGEPPVVADEGGDPAERRPEHREPHVAGLEEEVLLVPEVHLAERPDVPGGADDDRGVVERLPVALANAGHQMEAVLARDVFPRLTGRSVRDLFRESKGFVTRLEDVTRVAELRQDDQPRAAACSTRSSVRRTFRSFSPTTGSICTQAIFTTASSRVFGSLMRPSAAPSAVPAPSSAPSA